MKMNNDSRRSVDSDDDFDDISNDPENPHDQLPDAESYKASMRDNQSMNSSGNFDEDSSRNFDENSEFSDDNHDLPTVEEYKTGRDFDESENMERPKSRAGIYTFCCLLLLLIIVTLIAVPLALRDKSDKISPDGTNGGGGSSNGSGPNGGSGSNGDSGNPFANPTRAPTPSANQVPRSERAISYLTETGLVDKAQLDDTNSPQAKATKWIIEDDTFDINVPNPENGTESRFAERWSLAVLYFSTGGEDWRYKLNFLSFMDHCDWYDRFVDPTGAVIRQGVTECQVFAPKYDGNKVSTIEISNNNLNGMIPKEIQHLPYLQTWITPFNADLQTGSSLDPFVSLSNSLVHLELQYCGLAGEISENVGNMKNLTFLGLGNNFMRGTIPESFFGLTNLQVLGLDDNLFESPIADFSKLNNMQKLYLEDNMITGQITEDLIRNGWESMVDLDLSVNRIEGPIPDTIWSMTSLEVLDIHGNDFTGQIPDIEMIHDKMFFFGAQDNSINGKIPESINNLVNLKHFDISANKVELPLPSTMSELTNLVSLFTGINGFGEHSVPDFLESMTDLVELSMKQNQLTGAIPTFMGTLTNLKVLDLDFNQLTGALPTELGNLRNLDTLMLNRNFLTGTIPNSFSGLTTIDVLLIDGNSLTGDADAICGTTGINTTAFSADCGASAPEITCSCCSICCVDSDTECNNFDWRINLDGIWEYDFQRVVYSFSQEILPASAKEVYNGGP